MDEIQKNFMKIQMETDEERLKFLMDQVCWAVTHRGLVSDDGIFQHLKDAYDICKK